MLKLALLSTIDPLRELRLRCRPPRPVAPPRPPLVRVGVLFYIGAVKSDADDRLDGSLYLTRGGVSLLIAPIGHSSLLLINLPLLTGLSRLLSDLSGPKSPTIPD